MPPCRDKLSTNRRERAERSRQVMPRRSKRDNAPYRALLFFRLPFGRRGDFLSRMPDLPVVSAPDETAHDVPARRRGPPLPHGRACADGSRPRRACRGRRAREKGVGTGDVAGLQIRLDALRGLVRAHGFRAGAGRARDGRRLSREPGG